MKRLALAIAALVAAPAIAQPPADWSKPVTGVDAPSAPAAQTTAHIVDLAPSETEEELARRWEREQTIHALRDWPVVTPIVAVTAEDLAAWAADAETPLPPPCEPPLPRAPSDPPGPPTPAPAPCRP